METTLEISPFRYSLVELSQTEDLIKEIKRILKEGESHNSEVFSRTSWDWQYKSLPSKNSKIYGVFFNDQLYGYYHVPIYEGVVDGKKVTIGVIQDVAISRAARGKGLFKHLATFVHENLAQSEVDLIFTFPNDKSIHTFLKYNQYKQVSVLPSYIFLTNAAAAIGKKTGSKLIAAVAGFFWKSLFNSFLFSMTRRGSVSICNSVSDEVSNLFEKNDGLYNCRLSRTKKYLQWRFFDKPENKYQVLSFSTEGVTEAAIVIRPDIVNGLNAIIVMDLAYDHGKQKSLMRLLREVSRNASKYFNKDTDLIFFCANEPISSEIWKIGFIRIPERFIPRPLKFLVKNIKPTISGDTSFAKNWKVTLSDWDVL